MREKSKTKVELVNFHSSVSKDRQFSTSLQSTFNQSCTSLRSALKRVFIKSSVSLPLVISQCCISIHSNNIQFSKSIRVSTFKSEFIASQFCFNNSRGYLLYNKIGRSHFENYLASSSHWKIREEFNRTFLADHFANVGLIIQHQCSLQSSSNNSNWVHNIPRKKEKAGYLC